MADQRVPLLVIGMKGHADSVIFEALRRKGYRLRCLADAQQAPKAAEEEDYGLVIFNTREPKNADLEIVAKLRVRHSLESLPIVVVTDRADTDLVVKMLEVGANDCLLRPLSTSISLSRVEQQVRIRQAIQVLEKDRKVVRETLNSIPDFIFRVGRDGTILDLSSGVPGTLLRITPEMAGRNIAEALPPEICEAVQSFLAKDHETGTLDVCRSPIVCEQGEVFVEIRLVACQAGQAVCIVRDVTEQHKVEMELQELAKTDTLTQIANRRQFDEIFAREWRRQARARRPMALLIADIDYFKLYNDSLGHPQGDLCLVRVARGIQDGIFRPGDFLTRYGGEEFAVILTETDLPGALLVAERVRQAVEGLKITHPASPVRSCVTVSIGVSATIPDPDQSEEILLQAADQALYEAKRKGRNRVAGKGPEDLLPLVSNLSHG